MTEQYDEEDLMHTMHLWLKYTAIAMGETAASQGKNNGLVHDPVSSVLNGYIYACGGGPISIYALAKHNKLGSYRTVRRRVDNLVERGLVQKVEDGVMNTPQGAALGRDYARKILTFSEKVQKRKQKRNDETKAGK